MSLSPFTEYRKEKTYVCIPATVTMEQLGTEVPRLFDKLESILKEKEIPVDGPFFVRYLVINMEKYLEIEAGVPLAHIVPEDERFRMGLLPAGTYVTIPHIGHYEGLVESNAELQRWAEAHDVHWDTWPTSQGTAWGARLEYFLVGSADEIDADKWVTEVCYKTSDV